MSSRWVTSEPLGRPSVFSYAALKVPEKLAVLITIAYLAYVFVGVNPLSANEASSRAEGSLAARVFVISMFFLSCIVLILKHYEVILFARYCWPIIVLIAACAATSLASEFVHIAVRRSILLIMLTTIAFAIVIGLRRKSDFLLLSLVFLGVVVAINLTVAVIMPDITVGHNGVRGIYPGKNVAGAAAASIVFAAYAVLIGVRQWHVMALAACVFGLALLFLALTESKTSIGLVALIAGVVAPLFLIARWNAAAALIVVMGLLSVVSIFLLIAAINAWEFRHIADTIFGDATFSRRTDLWSFSISEIGDRPWIGAGYGGYWDVGEVHDPLNRATPGTWLDDVAYGKINQAHNGYLDLALHVGIPLTVVAIWISVRSLVRAYGLVLQAKRKEYGCANAFLYAFILLFYLLHNFMEATLLFRGQLLFGMALPVMFLVERAWFDEKASWKRTGASNTHGPRT